MATPEEYKIHLEKLENKYAAMGQDMTSYLDGLLCSNYLTYWDYTQVDTLLSLQYPKTDFPDELIFIMYHQITELYFKLALHELNQIAHNGRNIQPNGEDLGWNATLNPVFLTERLGRINRYFEALTKSFAIMGDGMEPEQFLRFRMALLPASGFQSAQYRMIEICCTDLMNLTDRTKRDGLKSGSKSAEELFEHIYWKQGATEEATGRKTLTLKQFEKKYSQTFIELAKEYSTKNVWAKYKSLSAAQQKEPALLAAMRELDMNVNVRWPQAHFKSAAKYLTHGKTDVAATGGTNWKKYLNPRSQHRVFFPELWTAEELENWGK